MKTRKTNNKGISLIVLVITIIVMIVLASAVVLSLSSSGIMDKAEEAVNSTNLKQVEQIATMLWADAYANGIREQEELEEAVMDGLKEVESINVDDYTVTVTVTGTTVVENVNKEPKVPVEWSPYVVDIVDGVPIPKGFVASPYENENTKEGGLVIYELVDNETEIPSTESYQTSLTSRNQYVWIPVEDFTKFKRQNFDIEYTIGNEELGKGFWEVLINDETNLPYPTLEEQGSTYMTADTLAEVQAMYASVKEYNGFYIARYEAGVETQRTSSNYLDKNGKLVFAENTYSRMGKIPYTFMSWTENNAMGEDTNGLVQISRQLYSDDEEKNTSGVRSTLIYGVQWDRVLAWWKELDVNFSVISSTSYGNYIDHVIEQGALNPGAQYASFDTQLDTYQDVEYTDEGESTLTKADGTSIALTTGALKAASVKNIYDMAGNMFEITMEGVNTEYRVYRGGSFHTYGITGKRPVASRRQIAPNGLNCDMGFRTSLYIKMATQE